MADWFYQGERDAECQLVQKYGSSWHQSNGIFSTEWGYHCVWCDKKPSDLQTVLRHLDSKDHVRRRWNYQYYQPMLPPPPPGPPGTTPRPPPGTPPGSYPPPTPGPNGSQQGNQSFSQASGNRQGNQSFSQVSGSQQGNQSSSRASAQQAAPHFDPVPEPLRIHMAELKVKTNHQLRWLAEQLRVDIRGCLDRVELINMLIASGRIQVITEPSRDSRLPSATSPAQVSPMSASASASAPASLPSQGQLEGTGEPPAWAKEMAKQMSLLAKNQRELQEEMPELRAEIKRSATGDQRSATGDTDFDLEGCFDAYPTMPQSCEVFAVGEVFTARYYDGREVDMWGRDVNGYLKVDDSDKVKVLFPEEPGNESNRFSSYVYAQSLRTKAEGWLPVKKLVCNTGVDCHTEEIEV